MLAHAHLVHYSCMLLARACQSVAMYSILMHGFASKTLHVVAGSLRIIFRSNSRRRFPGFAAHIICFETRLSGVPELNRISNSIDGTLERRVVSCQMHTALGCLACGDNAGNQIHSLYRILI